MENETQNITMDEVMESFGENNNRIDPGDIIKGKVVSVKEDELVINIGFYADGVLAKNEFEDGVEDLRTAVKEGEEISVLVVKVDDGEGNVILSKKRADQIVAWDELKEVHDNDKVMTLPVNNVVKGGVTVSYKGVRGFIPASQLSVDFVKDLKPYVGVELAVKLIEFDKEARKVIFSHRVIEEVERKRQREEMLNKIEKGQRYNGKVVRLQRFGAFVDIGGVQGLIHNNDLSWTRIKHPSEVVKEGDVVDVYVMDFDREKGKIGLGLKDVNDNPWNKIAETLKVGDVVEGKVTRLAAFGAFVALEAGIEGLVHISEIDEKRINKPEDELEKGQEVKVKVLNIDTEKNKLSLSIKAAKEEAARASIPVEYKEEQDLGTTLGDVFNIKLD